MKLGPRLFTDRKGAVAIEYALMAMLIAVAAIAAISNLGTQVGNTFNQVDEKVGGTS